MRVTGSLVLSEVLTLIKTARADVAHQMVPMLVDAREATTDMTDGDIDEAVAAVGHVLKTQGLRGHVALVADDEVLHARLLRYEHGCAAAGAKVIRTFSDIPHASDWLEIVSAARYYK